MIADLASVKVETPPKAKVTPLPTAKPAVKREPLFVQAREFVMPDGRAVTIVRHAVCFILPTKTTPDKHIFVALKGSKSVIPLVIPYGEFKTWWEAK
jgi:hypothetical protein